MFLRRVTRRNFLRELHLISSVLRRLVSPVIFLDTEFPGTIHRPTKHHAALSPAERYALIRANVDDLRPIQVGLTLSDSCTGGVDYFTWEFDLCDFDPRRHPHAPESIALLESSGMDFDRLRREGVPSTWLARLLFDVGLIGSGLSATWVAFQGGYDFGFLMKMVTRVTMPPWGPPASLPATLADFLGLASLERVAAQLGVERTAGKNHQAGSDSLLTCKVFFRMKEIYFHGRDDKAAASDQDKAAGDLVSYEGVLAELETDVCSPPLIQFVHRRPAVPGFSYSAPYLLILIKFEHIHIYV
ncbi:putative CCR4-associated factor 1 like 11 [Apostasia shenzhenica]|uniref:poly(A)-specific ribonuclease n=1 Tax=Apostasia shenzhenica TaxID=1088818 RepID=A0A2I0AGE4_9ASPA|nr:putative CCR4-associated factor 1 like 11 [Apostasia shenzhenica]